MAITQWRSKHKKTGGTYKKLRKKKKRDIGSDFIPVKVGEHRKKTVRGLGGNVKHRILETNLANVTDKKTGKTKRVKILTVKENPANPHFIRMNVITKGAIVETELGLARIVSKPSQHGVVNAVLIEEKK